MSENKGRIPPQNVDAEASILNVGLILFCHDAKKNQKRSSASIGNHRAGMSTPAHGPKVGCGINISGADYPICLRGRGGLE